MAGGFVATAYGPPWGGIQGAGTTATGVDLHAAPHKYLVAVDPSVIPLGSKLKVWPNPFGDPNLVFTAADTGGAIKGNRIDFYDWRGRRAQLGFGRQSVAVQVVGKGSPADVAGAGSSGPSPASDPAGAASASTDAGGIVTQGERSGALKALLWVALVVGGAAVAGVGVTRLTGARAPASSGSAA